MSVIVNQWGTSLGVRIPAHMARSINLKPGDKLDVIPDKQGNILLRRAVRQHKSLRELLKSVKPGHKEELMWKDGPVGQELL